MNQQQSPLSEAQQAALSRAVHRFRFTADELKQLSNQLENGDSLQRDLLICGLDPEYFIRHFVKIYDADTQDWIHFGLWVEQVDVLNALQLHQFVIVLKARQLGLTWLALSYALWLMLFRPIAVVLIFSKRDDEAMYLLSDERLRGMYERLPSHLKAQSFDVSNKHQLKLSNGSTAYAFPTTGGDSYTATFVICDEADLLPNLNKVLRSMKPTIDAGGKLMLLSRVDKTRPESPFKKIYRAAIAKTNGWFGIFLPWSIRPERDAAWYERMRRDALERTGSLDDLYEQYPSTPEEALSPVSLNKRLPPAWLNQCYVAKTPLDLSALPRAPQLAGLKVYEPPQSNSQYVIGVDCAEGLATSDDSVTTVVERNSGRQVAVLRGKITPTVHAVQTAKIATWYNKAKVMIESNNHGHACIAWFEENGQRGMLLSGHNGKVGWTTNALGKDLMYTTLTETIKDNACIIHDPDTFYQLQSIEVSTLSAPEGQHDDLAIGFALAISARHQRPRLSVSRAEHNLWGNR